MNQPRKPEPTLKELAGGVTVAVDNLLSQIEDVRSRIAVLQQAGIAHGSISYKARRYAYLIHPARDGQRLREYIGIDPATIADAEARLVRGDQVDRLHAQLTKLEYSVWKAASALHDFYITVGVERRGEEYRT